MRTKLLIEQFSSMHCWHNLSIHIFQKHQNHNQNHHYLPYLKSCWGYRSMVFAEYISFSLSCLRQTLGRLNRICAIAWLTCDTGTTCTLTTPLPFLPYTFYIHMHDIDNSTYHTKHLTNFCYIHWSCCTSTSSSSISSSSSSSSNSSTSGSTVVSFTCV